MTFSKEVPFFANPMFFPSPPKTYEIPIYAEAVCMQAGGITVQDGQGQNW